MASILPFNEVFKQKKFRIPDYRREYCWEESQLEDLWADLSNIQLQNNAYHFTGILTINNFSFQDYDSLKRERFGDNINRAENTVSINEETQQPISNHHQPKSKTISQQPTTSM